MNSDRTRVINQGLTNKIELKLKWNEIQDEKGLLGVSSMRHKYADFYGTSQYYKSRDSARIQCDLEDKTIDCKPYMQSKIVCGGETITYTRSYRGVLETFGHIGGTKDILFSVFGIIYLLKKEYNRNAKFLEAVNGVKAEKSSSNFCKTNK